jgi:hypothetical protein
MFETRCTIPFQIVQTYVNNQPASLPYSLFWEHSE